ncbi:STM3941 family protein [Tenacibaculum sp. M341]|uniref:STM3941 family protein n=1 Tax=Tenacibaculum sp. M341 TaxID=2530339 RepID=UPI0010514F7E|nr:STM3941 family protein [Tenacibaculum sp. M341]TCI85007.1 hypothetical protein EYW44_18465 [Tenacibaculum sp. M341]
METQIFKPNKKQNIILMLVCLIFIIGGVFMIKSGEPKGWFVAISFGLGIIVSIVQLYPNASYLKLTEEGFEVKSMFRASFTKWADIKDLRKGSLNGNKMIFFDYTDEHKKWKQGKKVAKFLSGKEGAIPSSYNIKTDDLLALMLTYKSEVVKYR